MKKGLLWLVAIPLVAIGSLTYANDFIVPDTENWTITVYSQDYSYWITIQDKNLWASEVWTWESSYWDFYQWWNNNWNPSNSIISTDLLVRNSGYDNKWYNWTNNWFIKLWNWSSYTNTNYDIWADNELHDNVWWGGNDNEEQENIVKWYDTVNHVVTNPDNRQWPCPEWYHVPSAWEWQELMMLWCNANSGICDSSAIKTNTNTARTNYLNKSGIWTAFSNDLQLPLAGGRDYGDGAVYVQGDSADYWSSSPRGGSIPNGAWSLRFDSNYVIPSDSSDRAIGRSLRCFKNEYEQYLAPSPTTYTVTFLDDGQWVASWTVEDGDARSETVPTPNDREWYSFDYRYADGADNTTGFDFTAPITADTILHAKWTLTAPVPNWIYTWLSWWDITVIRNDETRWNINLTLASENLNGNYKWGTISTSQGYSSDDNAWWWNGDTYANWLDDWNERYKRQWPCPEWYHVPSVWEVNALAIARCNIDEECHARYSTETRNGIIGDLQGYTENNKLIRIERSWLWSKFKTYFNMLSNGGVKLWLSSPAPNDNSKAQYLYIDDLWIDTITKSERNSNKPIRCFKNYVTIPPTRHTVTFLDDGQWVASWTVENGNTRSETVTPSEKEGYEFDYRYADGTNSEFNFDTPITEDTTLHAKWILTADIENWIYAAPWWDKTVVYNNWAYNINLTIAWENLPEAYQRWTTSPWEDYSTDDDAWWWWDDRWWDSWNERYKRQWPCGQWYHVPSAQEWSDLVIAWCSLDDDCNFDEDDFRDYGYDYWFLYDEEEIWFWTKFKEVFNIADNEWYFWSSSPFSTSEHNQAYVIDIEEESIIPAEEDNRRNNYDSIKLRCFKNYLSVPLTTYKVFFLDNDEYIWSGDLTSWSKIPAEVVTNYLTWRTKTWYSFLWWINQENDRIFDVENGIVTTWMVLNAEWQPITYTISFSWNSADITLPAFSTSATYDERLV